MTYDPGEEMTTQSSKERFIDRVAEQASDSTAERAVVIIAAYNEADLIADTIRSLSSQRPEIPIVVVDDGSTDNTAQVAEDSGAKVVRLEANRGKGGALNFCIQKMELANGPGAVLFLDADLGQSAPKALSLLDAVQAGQCDLAIAKFPRPKIKGGFGLVKGLARWGIHRQTDKYFDEPLSGQRAMTTDVLRKVMPLASGFGIEVKMTIDAMKAGASAQEREVDLSHRFSTRSIKGFYHRGRQFVAVARVLLRPGR